MATRQVDYATLLSQLLDAGYYQTIRPVVSSLARWEQGIIGTRLEQLDEEIGRLENADERLGVENPVLRALVSDVREVMDEQNRRLIEAVAPDLNEQGIIAGEQWFNTTTNPTGLSINFNRPDPEAIRALVDRMQSEAWRDKISGFADDIAGVLNQNIIAGVVLGRNPRATAREITNLLNTYPRYRAETLMRTMQLTAYRDANAAHVVANADIIEVQIRIAALDDRTCLACIALHGTELAVGERVDDHHNGRCTSVAIVKGRPREVVSGEDWFNGLPPDRQRSIAGHANYEAMRAGQVELKDFVQPYTDPLYGNMIHEASLKGILGGQAKNFYKGSVSETARGLDLGTSDATQEILRAARRVTPDYLENIGVADDELSGIMMGMLAFDPQTGNPFFDRQLIDDVLLDMQYDIWTIGRHNPNRDDITKARSRASAVLSAYEQINAKLTRKQERFLSGLATGNYDDVLAQMNTIKDNRMRTRYGGGTSFHGEKFRHISDDEGAARLREARNIGNWWD